MRRLLVSLSVFLLAFGLLALATQAKTSQYRSVTGATRLSKATKISTDRVQRHAEIPVRVVVCFAPADAPHRVPRIRADAPKPKRESFLRAFRFRPPPVFA